jgi:hypothetical protein
MRFKRRNLVWLGILGALAGVAILSPGVPAGVAFLLLASLGVVGAISLFDIEPRRLLKAAQDRSPIGGRISNDAREAAERARVRGAYLPSDMDLLDVGLIAMQERYSGSVMQRTRNLSLDDESARPYVTLRVPPLEADRRATVRFDMEDGHGDLVYSHEQQVYLRDGKMDILAGNQMPLFDSTMNLNPGDGDLRVYIDDRLVGVLGFTLGASTRDRWAGRRQQQQQRASERLQDRDGETSSAVAGEEAPPLTLEDLLRQNPRD